VSSDCSYDIQCLEIVQMILILSIQDIEEENHIQPLFTNIRGFGKGLFTVGISKY
jgi:hypothetical protein